jgi:hypothetical protein
MADRKLSLIMIEIGNGLGHCHYISVGLMNSLKVLALDSSFLKRRKIAKAPMLRPCSGTRNQCLLGRQTG